MTSRLTIVFLFLFSASLLAWPMLEDPDAGSIRDTAINRARIEEQANRDRSSDLNSTQNQTSKTEATYSENPNNISDDMSNIKPTTTTFPEIRSSGAIDETVSLSSSSATICRTLGNTTLPTGHDNEHTLTDVTGTSSKTRAVADKVARLAKYQAALQRASVKFLREYYGGSAKIKRDIEDQDLADQVATERAYRESHGFGSMQPHWKVTAPTEPIPDVLTDEDLDSPAGINIPGIPERLVSAWVETRHDTDRTEANTIFKEIFSVARRNHEISLNPEDLSRLRVRLENRLSQIAQEENQKIPYDGEVYFANHSITVENDHGMKAAGSSSVSASSAIGVMNGHEIEVLSNAQPQYMRIVQTRAEGVLSVLKEDAEETARQLSMFRNIDPGIDGSQSVVIQDGILLLPPESAIKRLTLKIDTKTEANRKTATHFFDACKKFYGETLLNDLYPAAEREKLLAKGEPLTVATVRSILKKSDKVVSEVVAYFKELPHLDSNVAEHVILAKNAQEELDKALVAFHALGEHAQHLGEAVMHSMTALNATIFSTLCTILTFTPVPYFAGVIYAQSDERSHRLQEKTLVSLLSRYIREVKNLATDSPFDFRFGLGAAFVLTAMDAVIGNSVLGVGYLLGGAIPISMVSSFYAGKIASHASFWAREAVSRFSTVLPAKESARATLINAQKKASTAHARAIAIASEAAQQALDVAHEMPEEGLQRDPVSGVLSFTPAIQSSIERMHDSGAALADAQLAAQKNAEQPKIKATSVIPLPPWKRGAGI